MDIMFEQYLERQNRLHRDPDTIRVAGRVLREFGSYLEEVGVHPREVESWVVEEYVLGVKGTCSRSTKHTHLCYIGAAYRYAMQRRQVDRNPAVDVRLPKAPDREPRVLSHDELCAIYSAIETRREEMGFHLLAYAGLRRSEAASIREGHVDMNGHTLTVHGKGSKIRKVPIHPALWDVLDRQLEGVPTQALVRARGRQTRNANHFAAEIVALAARAGVEATPHDFRRTAASSLYANDVPEHTIDRLFGWSARTVGRKFYLKVADPKLQQAILRLYQDAPIADTPKGGPKLLTHRATIVPSRAERGNLSRTP